VDFELIVIDRGSTDGTMSWLETRRPDFACLEVVPGCGPFAAMNQAVAAAGGDWILFLGARDRLVGEFVLSESLNWMKTTEAGVVAGEAAADDGRLSKLRSHPNPIARDFVPRSATFYRRPLFIENDGFDPALAHRSAYDFHLRLWKSRVRFKPVPLRIAACEAESRPCRAACLEEIRVRHRYFPAWRCLGWDMLSLLRWLGGQKTRASSPSP
jgi:glycosyltransferase involved in cell wall biosynthesis